MVTLREVAARAGVDPATASRALRGSPLVKKETALRVAGVAASLGYLPNQAAASLRTQRTLTVGVLVADLAESATAELLAGAEEELRSAGFMFLTASVATGEAGEDVLAGMLKRRVDGLIIAAHGDELVSAVGSARVPVVVAGHPGPPDIPCAYPDLRRAASLAAAHLAAFGHRTVACVTAPGEGLLPDEILAAVKHSGLSTPPALAVRAAHGASGDYEHLIRRMLEDGPAFTAVICGTDALAAACCAALALAGHPCPECVSVTGCGDMPLADALCPPLTTIWLPHRETGAAAARLLLRQLDDPGSVPATVRLAPRLTARGSVVQRAG
jgi:LacI family transcriptional regulator